MSGRAIRQRLFSSNLRLWEFAAWCTKYKYWSKKKRPGVLRRTGLFFDEAVGFSLTYFKIVFVEKKMDEKINKIKDFLT